MESKQSGELKLLQNIVTSEDTTSTITTADLHVSPNGKYVLISSRDKSAKNNEIISFKINKDSGKVRLSSRIKSEHLPRSFCMSKSGKFIYVAGQGDSKLGAYTVNPDNGSLKKITQYDIGAKAIWVESLRK